MRGESGYSPVPVFGGDVMGSDTIARAFRRCADSTAKAVDLPHQLARAAAPWPRRSSAPRWSGRPRRSRWWSRWATWLASGGYWITCGAKRIVADPGTITASIGVFDGHLAMSRFWEDKLGITWGRLDGRPTPRSIGSLEPWTPEQQRVVQSFLDRIYDDFLQRVSASRNMTREQVDAIGRGRVFTGEQAKERGLVDALGGFDAAPGRGEEAGRPEVRRPGGADLLPEGPARSGNG